MLFVLVLLSTRCLAVAAGSVLRGRTVNYSTLDGFVLGGLCDSKHHNCVVFQGLEWL